MHAHFITMIIDFICNIIAIIFELTLHDDAYFSLTFSLKRRYHHTHSFFAAALEGMHVVSSALSHLLIQLICPLRYMGKGDTLNQLYI